MAANSYFFGLSLALFLLFCLHIKVINAKDIAISYIFDPTIPILNQKLCITPKYTMDTGDELKQVWLTDDVGDTIYMYSFSVPKDTGFNYANQWTSKFDGTYNVSINRLCFKNLTKTEANGKLKWKIQIFTRKGQDIPTDNYGVCDIIIKAAEIKEAGLEIRNLTVHLNPTKPIQNKDFCITLKYNIASGYFLKEAMLQAAERSERVIVYTYRKNSIHESSTKSFNETEPWQTALDRTYSYDTRVCFKSMPQAIIRWNYFWRVRIEGSNDPYYLRDKELSFILSEGNNHPITTRSPGIRTAMSIGAIVGIIFAAVVILVIIIIIIVWKRRGFVKNRRMRYHVTDTKKNEREKSLKPLQMDDIIRSPNVLLYDDIPMDDKDNLKPNDNSKQDEDNKKKEQDV